MNYIDARFMHPFTCIVSGPSGSGKSTFVKQLLEHRDALINGSFDYVYIFLGTDKSQNDLLSSLVQTLSPVKVIIYEIKKLYPEYKDFKLNFSKDLLAMIRARVKQGKQGCLVFDDLMIELADSGVLTSLFTKISTHYAVSIIHITQNLFFKGKYAGDSVTLYRNTKILVIFDTPNDISSLRIIASRLGEGKSTQILAMLKNILAKYRYVVIRGDFKSNPLLRFTTDIFKSIPGPRKVPYQRVFQPSPL
jgi:Cdc6-like AAA superfamily ATPase